MKKLSLIIINYGTKKMTEEVIRNFLDKEKSIDTEIILINNKSEEIFDEKIFRVLGCKVIQNVQNVGFARAVNQGIKMAGGEYILLLNSDVLVCENSIKKLVAFLDRNKEVGIVGPQIIYPDGRFQISFGNFPTLFREFLRLSGLYRFAGGSTIVANSFLTKIDLNKAKEVDWVTGGCMMFRKNLIIKIGAMDDNYFLGVEDIDFCYRAKNAGYKIMYLPTSVVIHKHGGSSGESGTKNLNRIKFDRNGLDYYFSRYYPEKTISRSAVNLMHDMKIILLKTMNFFREIIERKPIDATIAITYACNSRCEMCNIWQIKNPPFLSPETFKNISPNLKYINISGGEPFLHSGIEKIIKTIKEKNKNVQIIISSNGFASDLIVAKMEKIIKIDPKIGVRISIDGIGDLHNKVRGVANIYENAMQTISGLRWVGVKNLGISFTVMDANVKDLINVYKLSKKLNLQLALALVQNSDIYFGKKDNKINFIEDVERGLNFVIKEELASWNIKKWGRAFYDWGLLHFAKTGKRLLPSGAGFDSLFIDPNGDVYPSNLINLKIGNIQNAKLDNVWASENAKIIRKKIKNEKIEENWIICTIRGEMKKNLFKLGFWALRNKVKLILR